MRVIYFMALREKFGKFLIITTKKNKRTTTGGYLVSDTTFLFKLNVKRDISRQDQRVDNHPRIGHN